MKKFDLLYAFQVYKIRQEYLKAALNQDFQYFDVHQTGDFAVKMTK